MASIFSLRDRKSRARVSRKLWTSNAWLTYSYLKSKKWKVKSQRNKRNLVFSGKQGGSSSKKSYGLGWQGDEMSFLFHGIFSTTTFILGRKSLQIKLMNSSKGSTNREEFSPQISSKN